MERTSLAGGKCTDHRVCRRTDEMNNKKHKRDDINMKTYGTRARASATNGSEQSSISGPKSGGRDTDRQPNDEVQVTPRNTRRSKETTAGTYVRPYVITGACSCALQNTGLNTLCVCAYVCMYVRLCRCKCKQLRFLALYICVYACMRT